MFRGKQIYSHQDNDDDNNNTIHDDSINNNSLRKDDGYFARSGLTRQRFTFIISLLLLPLFLYIFAFYAPSEYFGVSIDSSNSNKNDMTENSVDFVNDATTLQAPRTNVSFIIFTTQRSGSGWLRTMLDTHPHIYCASEILMHASDIVNVWPKVRATLDSFFADSRHKAAVIGTKIMYNQGLQQFPDEFVQYVREHNIRLVHLIRRNFLRRTISAVANRHDGEANDEGAHHAHPQNEAQVQALLSFKPNVTVAARQCRRIDSLIADMKLVLSEQKKSLPNNNVQLLQLFYEDVVADPHYQLRLLQLYLGVHPTTLSSHLKQIHGSQPLEELVSNPQQVRDALLNSPYAHFLAS